jgi:hypothetical protein
MAFSIALTAYAKDGTKILSEDPYWWDKNALMEDPRFTCKNETGSYFDFFADLSYAEARALHEKYRPEANAWGDKSPQLATLDALFARPASDFSRFRVLVYEWDTGLD